MKKVMVLGCGRVGACIAVDLAADEKLDVTVVDAQRASLDKVNDVPRLKLRQAELVPEGIGALVMDCDAVVGALPSVMGFEVLKRVIQAGKPYCDISFMPEDFLELGELAKERGVTAVADCGVAPGLANWCIGHAAAELDALDRAVYFVGGLPRERAWPFEYKAPFAPYDVLEEYTRPVRQRIDGIERIRPALSDPEPFELSGVGTLEAFNTDGLRSLLKTIAAPTLWEKTLRYPAHAELMRAFVHTGLLSEEKVELADGQRVRPRDLTARLLFDHWQLEVGEAEFTTLKVEAEGTRDGRSVRMNAELFDDGDPEAEQSSMARTTGFPCAIVTRWLLEGVGLEPGVLPPEKLGMRKDLTERMVAELADRHVELKIRFEESGE